MKVWAALSVENNRLQLYCFYKDRETAIAHVPEGCPSLALHFPVDDEIELMQRLINWFNRNGVASGLLMDTVGTLRREYLKMIGEEP